MYSQHTSIFSLDSALLFSHSFHGDRFSFTSSLLLKGDAGPPVAPVVSLLETTPYEEFTFVINNVTCPTSIACRSGPSLSGCLLTTVCYQRLRNRLRHFFLSSTPSFGNSIRSSKIVTEVQEPNIVSVSISV
jgi:hypothetical protein